MPTITRVSIRRALLVASSAALVLSARPVRAQSSAWGPNGFISINGLYDASTRQNVVSSQQAGDYETATITATQEIGTRPLFDITAGGPIRGNFGLGFGVTFGTGDEDSVVGGNIPHPFYFDRPRTLHGSVSLDRSDLALHVHPMWLVPISPKLAATVFGGATWFRVTQETLKSLSIGETYPYDEVSLVSVERERKTASHWGYNAGFDVSYFFSTHLGVQGLVRYSAGTVTVTATGLDSDLKVGGLHAGAGLRIRY